MENYTVTTGIFAGTNFAGTELNGRIINKQTTGQSYPAENCKKIESGPELETIKSLADFKKLLIIGAKVHCIFHQSFNGRDENKNCIYKDEDKGTRPVSIKQTNSFALKTTKTDGEEVNSWCSYPKASECIIKDNQLTILQENRRYTDPNGSSFKMEMIPVLTYSILKK